MTRITGFYFKANPCYGIVYSTPHGSINLSARAYWTDGFKVGALMPDGHGLRQCKCGNFYHLSEQVSIREGDSPDAPSPAYVKPENLPKAIASARNPPKPCPTHGRLWHH